MVLQVDSDTSRILCWDQGQSSIEGRLQPGPGSLLYDTV